MKFLITAIALVTLVAYTEGNFLCTSKLFWELRILLNLQCTDRCEVWRVRCTLNVTIFKFHSRSTVSHDFFPRTTDRLTTWLTNSKPFIFAFYQRKKKRANGCFSFAIRSGGSTNFFRDKSKSQLPTISSSNVSIRFNLAFLTSTIIPCHDISTLNYIQKLFSSWRSKPVKRDIFLLSARHKFFHRLVRTPDRL